MRLISRLVRQHPSLLISKILEKQQKMSTNTSCEDLSSFVQNGRKILGAALNYMDVVKARNLQVPKLPVLFLKPTTSYIKEGQDIVLPRVFNKVAYEVELGCIISRSCKNVSEAEAMNYIGGYCLALDLTAQCELGEARKNGQPWTLGKGFDTSTPVSSFIPASCVSDPHNLTLWLKVNGEIKQNGNTKDLLFKLPALISFASKYMTLEANDLILTGTPDGAGPMQPGDMVECGLGELATFSFKVRAE